MQGGDKDSRSTPATGEHSEPDSRGVAGDQTSAASGCYDPEMWGVNRPKRLRSAHYIYNKQLGMVP